MSIVFLTCDIDEDDSTSLDMLAADMLRKIHNIFGTLESVKIRRSSGGNYHIMTPFDMPPEVELQFRKYINDCSGRQTSDESRKKAGLRTSRLFKIKSITNVETGKTTLRKAGRWQHAKRWLNARQG